MTTRYAAHDTAVTVLSTELNSLASDARVITSTALSNDASGERALFAKFSLSLAAQTLARDAWAHAELYIIPEVDGTYAYGGSSLTPSPNVRVGSFKFDAATAARVDIVLRASLPNSDYHVLLVNATGQSFASTGNVLKMEVEPGYEDV